MQRRVASDIAPRTLRAELEIGLLAKPDHAMSSFKEAQIIAILKEHEAGATPTDVCRSTALARQPITSRKLSSVALH